MEIVRIDLSFQEAIEARIKRSKIITFDMVDKIYTDAHILVPIYNKYISKMERKLGIKYSMWSDRTLKEVERKFEEKYYPKGELKI